MKSSVCLCVRYESTNEILTNLEEPDHFSSRKAGSLLLNTVQVAVHQWRLLSKRNQTMTEWVDKCLKLSMTEQLEKGWM